VREYICQEKDNRGIYMEAALNGPQGRIMLKPEPLRLGGSPENSLVTNSSPQHTEVTPGPDGVSYIVTDLGSTNGTFVNEQRLTPHAPRVLQVGDVIRVGEMRYTYETTSSVGPIVAGHESLPGYSAGTSATQYGVPQSYPSQAPMSPGYPAQQAPIQPGGYAPVPPAQARPRGQVGMKTTIAIVVAVLIAGIFSLWFTYRSTPDKTLDAACTALKNSDANAYYDLLSEKMKTRTKKEDLQQIFTYLSALGGITSCGHTNVRESGPTATATLTVSAKLDGNANTTTSVLVNEGGTWKIDDSGYFGN
jgi:hypothetical protein